MAEPDFYQCSVPFSEQQSAVRARIGQSGKERLEATYGVQWLERDRACVAIVDEFLCASQCAGLIGLIGKGCAPSALFNADAFAGYRTSDSCNLSPYDPQVRQVDLAIAGLLAVDPQHGEALQGQRYHKGQQFKRHADFFYIDQPYWAEVAPRGGQRTWTAMIYLDEPKAGGATAFPHLGFEVAPRPGRLLAWDNMAPDGSPNSWTIHEGCAVAAGAKHIVTKWYREQRWS